MSELPFPINGPIPTTAVPATEPAMPPTRRKPSAQAAQDIAAVFEQIDGWDTSSWSAAELVLTQAALKHMLKTVEAAMGKRQMIAPHRRTP